METKVLQTLVGVYSFYGFELSDFAIRVWEDAVDGFDEDEVLKAFNKHLKDPDGGKWIPKPADIIRLIRGSASENALVAWGKVLHAARGGGSTAGLDKASLDAIDTLGGMVAVRLCDESENGFMQRRFCEAYRVYSARSDAPALESAVKRLGVVK